MARVRAARRVNDGSGAVTETACCEAWYGWTPDDEEICGRPGASYVTIGCKHEHIDQLYVCTVCDARGISCSDCHDRGHRCKMAVLSRSALSPQASTA